MTFRLNRRAFLRGLGQTAAAGLALPVLECMVNSKGNFFAVAKAANVAPPVRYLAYMIQNGPPQNMWAPTVNADGSYQLAYGLASLAHLKADFNQITNLDATFLRNGNAGNEHYNGQIGFWTGKTPLDGGIGAGPSMEWLLGNALGQGVTKFPAMTVSLPRGWSDRNGTTGKNTWINAMQPGTYLSTPKQLATVLLAQVGQVDQAGLAESKRRGSILDLYLADTERLQAKLSAQDKLRLDQHLSSVRQMEQQLQVANSACTPPNAADYSLDTPPGNLTDLQRKAFTEASMPLLANLVVFAFQCDLTRYVLFEVANAPAKDPTHNPADDVDNNPMMNDHYWSHRPGLSGELNSYYIDLKMKYWAMMLDGMKASSEGANTILYNSISLLGSDIADGAAHSFTNYPVIQVGQAGGRLKTGQLLTGKTASASGTTINNLHATLLTAAGLPTNTFGTDGTGRFPNLLV